jgi:hypothetical protein
MANPTGSTYLAANPFYTWVDGDVYEIPQTDQLEGAATGASFSGLGVVNQPHQLLLNKIQKIHGNQLVDETNISTLQIFQSLFTSAVGVNGYLKLGAQDTSRGQIDIIFQWGTISLLGVSAAALKNGLWSFNFPIAFPNAIWMLLPYFQSNATSGDLALGGAGSLVLEALTPLNQQGNQIATDRMIGTGAGSDISIGVASSPNDGKGLTGIGWVALGY